MCAIGRAISVRVPMCSSRVLLEVVSKKGTYGILVPMNNIVLLCINKIIITFLFRAFQCIRRRRRPGDCIGRIISRRPPIPDTFGRRRRPVRRPPLRPRRRLRRLLRRR